MTDRGTIRLKPRPRIRIHAVASGVALMLGLSAVVHGVFGWQIRRSLDAAIQSLRAAGERVLRSDFAPVDSSLRDNAAPDLIAAAAIVDDDSDEAWAISWAPITRHVDARAWPYLARAKVWFEPALLRIERARRKPICQWSRRLDSPAIDWTVPELNHARSLSNLVGTAVMVEHHDGRHDLVPLRLRQALYLADVCESTPAAVAHRAALGINFSVTERVESLAPDLRIGDAGSGSASKADVRDIIAVLLDEKTLAAGFRLSVDSDRMTSLDALEHLARGRDAPTGMFLFRPFVDLSTRRQLDHLTRLVNATRAHPDWPSTEAALDRIEPLKSTRLYAFVHEGRAFFYRVSKEHFQILTDRRLAATTLAIRLYQSDHGGRRPAQLDDLVPQYLPAIPIDPMSGTGLPIRYVPSPERPAVYSAGLNGADDLGSEAASPNEYGDLGAWQRLDRVFYLGGQAREQIYVPRPGPTGGLVVDFMGYPPWEEAGRAKLASTTQPGTTED